MIINHQKLKSFRPVGLEVYVSFSYIGPKFYLTIPNNTYIISTETVVIFKRNLNTYCFNCKIKIYINLHKIIVSVEGIIVESIEFSFDLL